VGQRGYCKSRILLFYGKETKTINWVQFRICTTEFYQQLRPKESLGWYELKQRKPWFDEECFRFLDQRKQAETLWLQNQNQNNVENLNNVSPKASRHFSKNKEKYLKGKMDELVTERTKVSEAYLMFC
jgi:hypothetical protein